jgi:hypothetical protein
VHKRQQKIYLRRLCGVFDWGRKLPPVHRLRAARKAVFFARTHGLEIPAEFGGLILVKLFSLLYERTCEVCRSEVIEKDACNVTPTIRPPGCACS